MNRYVTRKSIVCTVVFVCTALSSVWLFGVVQQPEADYGCTSLMEIMPRQTAVPTPAPVAHREEPQHLIDIFSDEDVSYNGYTMRSLTKKINHGHKNELEVSYAVLEKNGHPLLTFDGVYFILGNSTEFGLFDLLGNGSQQFVVSQTVPRGGRHWVVSVWPQVRVLFDSEDYGVGREEFYVIDIDKDGVYEIVLPVTAFYDLQDKMSISQIPLPEIIFKYDAKAARYLPANHLFPAYALDGIQRDIAQLHTADESEYLSRRLNILLRYVYARKAQEGWDFFEREYQRPDKLEIKPRIRSLLRQTPVYNDQPQ
jgi:hypothetical protein